jgi:hypothetical protein
MALVPRSGSGSAALLPVAGLPASARGWEARLHGGQLALFGLAPIPAWQAGDSDLPGLESLLENTTR